MNQNKPIEFGFTRENVLTVLSMGANPKKSPYSHKQIAEWCERFWGKYCDIDAPEEIEELMPILADVETQWDLYLASTYSLDQLQEDNFENVVLPVEWFVEWLKEANP